MPQFQEKSSSSPEPVKKLNVTQQFKQRDFVRSSMNENIRNRDDKAGFVRSIWTELARKPEVKKSENSAEEKSIFGDHGIKKDVFKRIALKYDPSINLKEQDKKELLHDMPTKSRERVEEKDVKKYLDVLRRKYEYDPSIKARPDVDTRIELGQDMKLLEKLRKLKNGKQ